MASRLELHETLCEILGNRNGYFQPPSSLKRNYPCIQYTLTDISVIRADNTVYKSNNAYQLILMDKSIENEFVEKILKLPLCSFDRFYIADGIYHWVFTIYH